MNNYYIGQNPSKQHIFFTPKLQTCLCYFFKDFKHERKKSMYFLLAEVNEEIRDASRELIGSRHCILTNTTNLVFQFLIFDFSLE